MSERIAMSKEYENAVADVLAFLAGDDARVERDVHMKSASGGTRQLDVTVRGTIFGMSDALMVVDCKRWSKRIDIADAGSFKSLVEDVGADFGLLISSKGASETARILLRSARGMRVDVMSLAELAAWNPPGTRSVTYRVPRDLESSASTALRKAGFRVRPSHDARLGDDEVALDAFRHYPRGENPDLFGPVGAALRSAGVEPDVISHGVVVSGGTPRHQWLEVTVDGVPIGLKVLADGEATLDAELARMKADLPAMGYPLPGHAVLDAVRPDGWPLPPRMFG